MKLKIKSKETDIINASLYNTVYVELENIILQVFKRMFFIDI